MRTTTRWPDLLSEAVAEAAEVVASGAGSNWGATAGRLDWDCRETVAHVASDFVAYAGQLAAPRQHGYVTFDVVLEAEPDAAELAEVLRATGGLLVAAATLARPDVVSWHPYGMAGPIDFCAMGIVEALVHTHDLSLGLQVTWAAPAALAAAALEQLFPSQQPAPDPWSTLLRATGRLPASDGYNSSWRWRNTGH